MAFEYPGLTAKQKKDGHFLSRSKLGKSRRIGRIGEAAAGQEPYCGGRVLIAERSTTNFRSRTDCGHQFLVRNIDAKSFQKFV